MTQPQSAEYVIAYGYNDKFYLTEEEAQAIVQATEQGKKIVKFSKRVFTTSYTWIMPIEEAEPDVNPILSDPIYQEYEQIKKLINIDEPTLKRKMALEKVLDRRYPADKFSGEWLEANGKRTDLSI